MWYLLLAVGLAVSISALCSVTEAVFYSVSWSHIERLRKSGRKSGEILAQLRRNVDGPITAILTLNTVANTAGAAVAGVAAVNVFGPDSLLEFSAIFTVIVLLFGEILPKTVGILYNRALSVVLARPLAFMVVLFRPVISVIGYLARILGKKRMGPDASEEDLHALVTLSRRAGILKPYEELSIKNILTLDTKTVSDIMTPRTVIFSLPANLTVTQARETRTVWPNSRIPIYDAGDPENITGIVFRREVLEALANDQVDTRLTDLMHPVHYVLDSLTLDRLLVKFLGSRTHLAIVLDEYGGLAGLVSLEDVLEEILGKEIVDETDQVADMRELAMNRHQKNVPAQDKADTPASST